MIHPSHEHALILNEVYISRDGDRCHGCGEKILSSKSYVYSCSTVTGAGTSISTDSSDAYKDSSCVNFLLHKNCAEVPSVIQNPTNLKEHLKLCFDYSTYNFFVDTYSYDIFDETSIFCDLCKIRITWFPNQFFYHNDGYESFICLMCVMYHTQPSMEDPKSMHPSHDQHLLSLIQHPSSFRCYACNVDDNIKDMSYRCTRCQFWIHKSCADAPMSFQFQFHDKHPLILSFSLPPVYHKFVQYCHLCNKSLSRLIWIYYCRYCRFFAHFQCARSGLFLRSSRENEKYDYNVVQLPPADELSVQLLYEKFITAARNIPMWRRLRAKNSVRIFHWIDGIKHTTDEGHHLQLMSSDDHLKNQETDDNTLLLCDGCAQPIRTDQFYGCVVCKYFLHKFCAELPKEIKHHLVSGSASMHSEPYKLFFCLGCGDSCNGIYFNWSVFNFHIGCVALPETIKHESHRHQLKHILDRNLILLQLCKGCGRNIKAKHGCTECDYYICGSCIMKPSVGKHPWDPHSLCLIYEPGMVIDHEHDFNCEFCRADIDSNFWFYHCSTCDLSFHLKCFEKSSYRRYSNIKFGATGIIIDKIHHHSLQFVLNKKFRKCEKCHMNQLGEPVLECAATCKSIFCISCIEVVTKEQDVLHDSAAE